MKQSALMFTIFAICLCNVAHCQQSGDDGISVTGSPLNGIGNISATGSSVEFVNSRTGNLHVSIPLLSLKGRGIDTDLRLEYDSHIWDYECDQDNDCTEYATDQSVAALVGIPRTGTWSYDNAEVICGQLLQWRMHGYLAYHRFPVYLLR